MNTREIVVSYTVKIYVASGVSHRILAPFKTNYTQVVRVDLQACILHIAFILSAIYQYRYLFRSQCILYSGSSKSC